MDATQFYNHPAKCMFEIDGVWVKGRCVRIAEDAGGGWRVSVEISDMPKGETLAKLERSWELKRKDFWAFTPDAPQFHVDIDSDCLKIIDDETEA